MPLVQREYVSTRRCRRHRPLGFRRRSAGRRRRRQSRPASAAPIPFRPDTPAPAHRCPAAARLRRRERRAAFPGSKRLPALCGWCRRCPTRSRAAGLTSSSRSSNDSDGGVAPLAGSAASIATTRRVTFNSPGSSISASHCSRAAAGTGIRRASLGSDRVRPGCAIYATDSS